MSVCVKCGKYLDGVHDTCPECGGDMKMTEREMSDIRNVIADARRNKEFETVYYYTRILADEGDTESEREYGRYLERGDVGTPDPDRAIVYLRRAAEKNDPYAAYRYARLLSRTSDAAYRFWLRYAAVLGCVESYPQAAALLYGEGEEARSSYYRSLAASFDDPDSIVTMAKCYYEGTGVEQSESYAKWYLDRLSLPPIHALRLAYRLRGIKSAEPPRVTFPDYDGYLSALIEEAKKMKFDTARYNLTSLLAERGDLDALCKLGEYTAEGMGTAPAPERAIMYLTQAAERQSAEAALFLGDLYAAGETVPPDMEKALQNYLLAASLGKPEAYGKAGDVYCEGRIVDRDIAVAITYYEKSAAAGDAFYAQRAEKWNRKREEFYKIGLDALRSYPVDAFKALTVSAAMGHPKAAVALGKCYENGIGTEIDRKQAFLTYKSAAERNIPSAYLPLATCYAEGIGTKFNFALASKYLKTASDNGSNTADKLMQNLLLRRRRRQLRRLYARAMAMIHQKRFEDATALLIASEPFGYPKALYTLGCLYEFGRGVPVDKAHAFDLYEKAYRGNGTDIFRDPRAVYKLEVLKMVR